MLHNRNLYSFLDLIEDFGGFYQMFIIAIFYIIGSNINKQILMSKLVRSLFYVQNSSSEMKYGQKSVIKFSTLDKFKHMVTPNRFLAHQGPQQQRSRPNLHTGAEFLEKGAKIDLRPRKGAKDG